MPTDIHGLIPLFVALPLTASVLIQLVARRRAVVAGWMACITMLLMLSMSVATIGGTSAGAVIYNMGGWETPIGIDLRLDRLTVLMVLTINTIGLAVMLYSVDYMRQYTSRPRFYSLFLLMVTGMNGVVMTGDLFNLYVFLEISAIASYALVAFGCEHDELEASFKYIVLGSISSSLMDGHPEARSGTVPGLL